MDYFGSIDELELKDKDAQAVLDLLIKKGFYKKQEMISNLCEREIFSRGKEIIVNKEYLPVKELAKDFYDFLIIKYKYIIVRFFDEFIIDFNSDTYGLGSKKKKKLGLQEFNNHYDSFDLYDLHGINRKVQKNGRVKIKQDNRLSLLFMAKLSRQNWIMDKLFIQKYLSGTDEFFNEELYLENDLIAQFVSEEVSERILVELNDMFHFENDQFYVNDYDLTKLFEEYDNIFTSYEALDFIYGEINELQTFIPTNIESLYQASLNKGLVNNDKKAFMEYLLVVHKIKIAKIRDYMKIPNYKHEQRVKKFEGKWENYKK